MSEETKQTTSSTQEIVHPSHYNSGKIEVWDFVEDQGLNFNAGNVVKYLCRAGKKKDADILVDLEKASEYLARCIRVEKKKKEEEAEKASNFEIEKEYQAKARHLSEDMAWERLNQAIKSFSENDPLVKLVEELETKTIELSYKFLTNDSRYWISIKDLKQFLKSEGHEWKKKNIVRILLQDGRFTFTTNEKETFVTVEIEKIEQSKKESRQSEPEKPVEKVLDNYLIIKNFVHKAIECSITGSMTTSGILLSLSQSQEYTTFLVFPSLYKIRQWLSQDTELENITPGGRTATWRLKSKNKAFEYNLQVRDFIVKFIKSDEYNKSTEDIFNAVNKNFGPFSFISMSKLFDRMADDPLLTCTSSSRNNIAWCYWGVKE